MIWVSTRPFRVLTHLALGGRPMAKKQFKTESKRLLDLMVNSIYTHKDRKSVV